MTQDFEAWFQELDPQSFGPGSFAVETSAALSAPLGELGGLKFHGWVRYGNLVSLVLVQAGVDLHGDEKSIKELLATRSGPFYTMEEFQNLLRAAYLGLKEGAMSTSSDYVRVMDQRLCQWLLCQANSYPVR